MYLDIVLIETRKTNFGDWRDEQTHIIVQNASKEERDRGEKGAIIGNASMKTRPKEKESPAETTPEEDSEVPF